MKKAIKIILLILGILIVGAIILYFLVMKGIVPINIVPINIVPGARTLYTGYVKIEPMSLADIKTKLEAQGCHGNDFKGETTNPCRYSEGNVSYENKNGIIVHPHGFGWGPLSFSLTEDRLWDTKDIPGPPNPDKFKEEVRQDVSAVGNMVQIKENTWKITETKYPWTVLY